MAYHNQAFSGDPNDATDLDDCADNVCPQTGADKADTSSLKENKPSGCFTFMDFCPQYKRKPDAWFFRADYETFR